MNVARRTTRKTVGRERSKVGREKSFLASRERGDTFRYRFYYCSEGNGNLYIVQRDYRLLGFGYRVNGSSFYRFDDEIDLGVPYR